jgi:hypothetical protein
MLLEQRVDGPHPFDLFFVHDQPSAARVDLIARALCIATPITYAAASRRADGSTIEN